MAVKTQLLNDNVNVVEHVTTTLNCFLVSFSKKSLSLGVIAFQLYSFGWPQPFQSE